MRVTLQHAGVGCNRAAGALHWGEGGLVAYAAPATIAVYDPQVRRSGGAPTVSCFAETHSFLQPCHLV